jgi:hypothetical protein
MNRNFCCRLKFLSTQEEVLHKDTEHGRQEATLDFVCTNI